MSFPPKPPIAYADALRHREMIVLYLRAVGAFVEEGDFASGQVQVPYTLDNTGGLDPAAGKWSSNNADPSLVTQLKFNELDGEGNNRATFLLLITAGSRVALFNEELDVYEVYDVSSDATEQPGGFVQVAVTAAANQGAFVADDEALLQASTVGNIDASAVTYTMGDDGDWTPDVFFVAPALDQLADRASDIEADYVSGPGFAAVDGLPTFDNANGKSVQDSTVRLLTGSGDPSGVVSANQNDIYIDKAGLGVYFNTNGGTLWQPLYQFIRNTSSVYRDNEVIVYSGSPNTFQSAKRANTSLVGVRISAPSFVGTAGDLVTQENGADSALWQNRSPGTGLTWVDITRASGIRYTPAEPGDWVVAPTEVKGALDELATRSRSIPITNGLYRTPSANQAASPASTWIQCRFDTQVSDDAGLYDPALDQWDMSNLDPSPAGWHYEVRATLNAAFENSSTGEQAVAWGVGRNGTDPTSGISGVNSYAGRGLSRRQDVAFTVDQYVTPQVAVADTDTIQAWFWADSTQVDFLSDAASWFAIEVFLVKDNFTG